MLFLWGFSALIAIYRWDADRKGALYLPGGWLTRDENPRLFGAVIMGLAVVAILSALAAVVVVLVLRGR